MHTEKRNPINMNKPFTLKIQELEQKIINDINDAGTEVPAFCIKVIYQSNIL